MDNISYHAEKFLESKEFIDRLKNNDKRSVDVFVEIYFEKLYRYFLLTGFNSSEAEEMVQQTLCKFFAKLRMTETAAINDISSYLFRVAKNCAVDEFRRKQKEKKSIQNYLANKTQETTPYSSQILIELLQKLQDTERDTIIFHLVLGRTFEETSDILNISLSKTKRIFYKALENLRVLYFSKIDASRSSNTLK
jgi:RNA polymerase sigma-70 factor (ECF subfamily)